MYFNMFGGSALLHLLAGYPRLVAVFGIAATVSSLTSPLGPGKHGSPNAYIQALNGAIALHPDTEDAVIRARSAAERLANTDASTRHDAVVRALESCGAHCSDLTPAIVEGDEILLNNALFLFALDGQAQESRIASSR